MKTIDISNQKFGRLTAIEKSTNICGKTAWKCVCDCGNIAYVTTSNLTCNRIRSCGCIKQEMLMKRNITHNQRHTQLYEVWKSIKQRCYNPKGQAYHNYGERGIKMCEEWLNNFQAFYDWSYANGYSPENQKDEKNKLTIDRIDVNGNYEPSNCRWVTRKVQSSNMRTNKLITINGETHCIAEWCRIYNVYPSNYYKKINKGMSPEEALTK
jgi:hypothetical protein